MNIPNKKVKIPGALHEIHGREAYLFDILVNYATGIGATVFILFLSTNLDLSMLKMILLGILALDLSGGVVSNFTSGTSNYYAASNKLRILFIGIHFIQPLLLGWIFADYWPAIAIIGSFSLLAAFLINSLHHYHLQKTVAPFFLVAAIIITVISNIDNAPLFIMMLLFVVKLILAFPVKWEQSTKV
ncbi:MAG: hypothetical protein ACOCXV_03185 [Bacteroidota bacterium]